MQRTAEQREAVSELLEGVDIGSDETNSGAVIGAVWGFVDGLLGGVLLAWIYNALDWRTYCSRIDDTGGDRR